MTGLDPMTIVSVLGLTLLGVAGLISMLPVATCAQCPHCRMEQLARERQHQTETGRFQRVPFCMVCGRYHRSDEDHER
jgi:hypothetical protein